MIKHILALNVVTLSLLSTPLQKKRRAQSKRKRLPNGFGSITEIKNQNLRNPFYVRKTVGKDAFGKPVLRPLKPNAYFATYNEAYTALIEFNSNPYDLKDDISVSDLYEKWTESYFPTLSSISSVRTITSAWAYCSSIYNMRAKDVRARHIKGCMEEGFIISKNGKDKGEIIKASPHTKSRIKSLFNLMFDYALEHEIVDMNYARTFDISKNIIQDAEKMRRGHIIISNNELEILWENVHKVNFVDMILIQCYSGLLPQELATLKLSEINLDNGFIQCGMKTDAGRNRIIPIHSKILELVKMNYDKAVELNSTHLFNDINAKKGGITMTYDKYQKRFIKVLDSLNINPEHRPHDPRKTFITLAKKANIDEYAIKMIVGHAINDITEKVYTERNVEWLKTEIEKI